MNDKDSQLTYSTPQPASPPAQLASPPAPLQGERGVICSAITIQRHMGFLHARMVEIRICSAITMLEINLCSVAAAHFTPLSPWRGAGGEAGCGVVVGRLFVYFLGFHSAGFSRHSFNSTTSSLAMYPVSTAFCTTCS